VNLKLIAIGGSILSFAAGAAAGYFVARRRAETEFNTILEAEIEETRKHYAQLYKRDEFSSPAEVLAKRTPKSVPDDSRPDGHSSFKADTEVVDRILTGLKYKKDEDADEKGYSIVSHDPDHPYVISDEMFMANTPGYSQIELTWFEDEVLMVDEDQEIVEDIQDMVGYENLKQFGHLSEDPMIVYVRNERREQDYEIKRSHQTHTQDVLGFVPDPQIVKYQPRLRRG